MTAATDNCDCTACPRRAIPWLRVVKLLLTIVALLAGLWTGSGGP